MFSKEYIKECDCKEIQELRKALTYGDFTTFSNAPYEDHNINCYPYRNESNSRNKLVLWLPTGDQLDEEIVKICKENDSYSLVRDKNTCIANFLYTNTEIIGFADTNPLIAKIKLLKQLKEMK